MSTSGARHPVKGFERIADALAESGVECIFGVLGDDTGPLIVATNERGIRYIFARHENQAVAMADGYSRATGRTGVVTVTGGPGFSNAITAINSAYRGKSRICVLVGTGNVAEDDLESEAIRTTPPVNWLKYFPQTAVLDILGISSVKPASVNSAWQETHRAMRKAASETVVLVLPRDVLEGAVDHAPMLEPRPAGLGQARQISNTAPQVPLYCGGEAPTDTVGVLHETSHASGPGVTAAGVDAAAGLNKEPVAPRAEQISAVADVLQETWAINRPLILAGRGALDAGTESALRRLGELTGALMATTLHANALFHGDPYNVGICGTYASPVASELIPQADCVLVFGAGLNGLTTYKNTLFPKAMIIQVDTDPAAFGRFVDVEMEIAADTRLTAEMLVAELERRAHAVEGFRSGEVRDLIKGFQPRHGVQDKSGSGMIDPRILMIELDRILPRSRILCADGGQQARFAIRYVHVEKSRNFLQASDAGAIGLGMGSAIGAAVSRPGEVVLAAIGDASMMMTLGDLETAIRLRLPILVVVSNDEALGSEVNFLSEQGLPTEVALTPSPSFAAIAQSMGGQAATVRSPDDLSVVERWLQESPGGPLVLDCRINPEIRAHVL